MVPFFHFLYVDVNHSFPFEENMNYHHSIGLHKNIFMHVYTVL